MPCPNRLIQQKKHPLLICFSVKYQFGAHHYSDKVLMMAIGICCAWSIMVPDHIFKAAGWELAGSSHKFFWETPSKQMAGLFQHRNDFRREFQH